MQPGQSSLSGILVGQVVAILPHVVVPVITLVVIVFAAGDGQDRIAPVLLDADFTIDCRRLHGFDLGHVERSNLFGVDGGSHEADTRDVVVV
jgi:hypothetical protein